MAFKPDALYYALLQDLEPYLPSSVLFEGGKVGPEASVTAFAAQQLVSSCFKKYSKAKKDDADQKALDKFLSVNARCADWQLDFSDSLDELLWHEFKSAIYDFWFKDGESLVNHFGDMLDHARLGPGSNIGGRGSDFYTKMFGSPLTATNATLYTFYRDWLKHRPMWQDAENTRSLSYGCVELVESSRLCFVPKYDHISRTIAVEPTLNMFYQLGFAVILQNRLREVFNISLDSQPDYNRELAQLGSMTGHLSTIDLESASDSLSISMLYEVLPKEFFKWLYAIRCPSMMVDDSHITLEMMSTMGNGTTFPLQTILFSCMISASYRVAGIKLRRNSRKCIANFGCFGDDIICVSEATSNLLRLLKLAGFVVNSDKSYTVGPFRESCGFDSFKGHDVRGVYIKDLDTKEQRFTVINNLAAWSAKTSIPLPRSISYLVRSVPKQYVPLWENEDCGICIPSKFHRGPRHYDRHTGSLMYKKSVARPIMLRYDDKSMRFHVPRGYKKRIVNQSGLYLSFLLGALSSESDKSYESKLATYLCSLKKLKRLNDKSSYRIGVRMDTSITLYNTKFGIAPNWDFVPSTSYPEEKLIPGVTQVPSGYSALDLSAIEGVWAAISL
jgi:hypothetical protein